MSAVLQSADEPRTVFTYDRTPEAYVHWRVEYAGNVATLAMNVNEEKGLKPGYRLKLNSYDLGVDMELYDALNRIRFEHPEAKVVVITSARERVSFVESDSRAIESNLAALGAGPDEFELLREDVRDAVATLTRRGERFDLVFADPPYGLKEALSRPVAGLLAAGGRLVVQTDASAAPGEFPALDLVERRAYGRNVFWFYEPRKA